MFREKRFVVGFFILMFAVVFAFGFAQGEVQTFTWTPSAGPAGMPEQVAPGFTLFTFENDGMSEYNMFLFRLNEGTAIEAFKEASNAVDQSFMGEGDPVAAFNTALELGTVMGELFAAPESTTSFGTVLEEGNYLLEVGLMSMSDDGRAETAEKSYHTFTVVGDTGLAAPEPDVMIQLVDFAFALPPDIGVGEQTWQVTNVGQQLHHMVLFKLNEGATMDDFQTWMQSEGGGGAPPADQAGGVGVMSPGQSVYVDMDLTPGDYVAVCFMPDHRGNATGQPHFMLGMMQSFSVAGN